PAKFGDYLDYLEDPRRQPFDDYNLVKNASVFETGGYGNFLGAMALTEAIAVLEDVGIEKIQAHNLELNKYLYSSLSAMGLQMQSSGEEEHMSSIVVFNFDGLRNNSVERERKLLRFLRERDIFVTVRCSTGLGGVRVSFHYYTDKSEIDVFLNAVREFMAQES
ncbi:MAG: aminotransferase class V-fold PLP-dependent enzyme, partial [Oscillospiraceae bacterium]|nr:aminotransferase class V-fold PLP-dependent enzyme [Oscillospiraceae bacterium]